MKPKTSRCPPVTDLIEEFRRRDGYRVRIHDPALASLLDQEKSIEEQAADALESMVKVILELEDRLAKAEAGAPVRPDDGSKHVFGSASTHVNDLVSNPFLGGVCYSCGKSIKKICRDGCQSHVSPCKAADVFKKAPFK